MNLRKLASETAIYGLSSILGRGLYFMLTPLYTGFFSEDTAPLGVVAHIFSIVSVLLVLSTLRLDVAYFQQYGKQAHDKLFGSAFLTMASFGGLLGLGLLLGSGPLSTFFGYQEYRWLTALAGGILWFDAMVELPLAKLRMERRPWRFAAVRMTSIGINLGLNLFWLYFLPQWADAPAWMSTSFSGIGYIFLANFISSAVVVLLISPELKGMSWRIDFGVLRKLLKFSLPLVIVGFSYIINEMLDRQLLPLLWSGGSDEGYALNGIYAQNYKLAMLLALFTQAFRYGAEPFFFRESGSKDAPENYARLAKYFLIAALLGCLVVSLYLPAFSQFFLQGTEYRTGSDVVPILLLANLCLGMYYNFSVWYKVTDKTKFGAYISVGGALITIVLLVLLIPEYGFYGCAWTTLICYAVMMTATWWIGCKYYPIPYEIKSMWGYTAIAIAIFGAYWLLSPKLGSSVLDLAVSGGSTSTWLINIGLATTGLAAFCIVVWINERKAFT
ncbi:MAG: lipopolysaccharide biosynthesis protein [Saprospiraceae bacterium]